MSVGKALEQAGSQVVFMDKRAGAPARLTVVGYKDLLQVFSFFRPFFGHVEEQEVFCRGKAEPTVGKVRGKDGFRLCCRVDGDQLFSLHPFTGVVEAVAAGHPAIMVAAAFHQNLSGGAVGHLLERFGFATGEGRLVGRQQVFPVR